MRNNILYLSRQIAKFVLRFVQHIDQLTGIIIERLADPVDGIYFALWQIYFHFQHFSFVGHILEYFRRYICFLAHIFFFNDCST